jgi:hypothetical protein
MLLHGSLDSVFRPPTNAVHPPHTRCASVPSPSRSRTCNGDGKRAIELEGRNATNKYRLGPLYIGGKNSPETDSMSVEWGPGRTGPRSPVEGGSTHVDVAKSKGAPVDCEVKH